MGQTVSVVIPMRNEECAIGACLEGILAQDYPAGLVEVLVVDGGSHDGSRAVVETYRQACPGLRLLDNPSGAIPAGLNIGIRASRGDIIARVDSRTVLAPDYISAGVRLLGETGASNVGGPVRSVGKGYMARAFALALESPFGMGGAAARYRETAPREVDTVYMGMYPRRVLEAVGLYDEEMLRDQDDELNFRVRARGGRVLFTPAMRSRYANSPSVKRYAKQYLLYGYFKARVFQKHPAQMSGRHLVPPALVAGLAGGAMLGLVTPWAVHATAAGALLYAGGVAAAALVSARAAGWRYAPGLAVAFPVFHLAWGAGILAGLVRFLPRWFRPGPEVPALAVGHGRAA